MAALKVKEKQIESSILSYLKLKGVFVFKIESHGVFDPKINRFRMKNSIHRMNGISDILGIFGERFLAIEVKSATGRLSNDQSRFLTLVQSHGGIGFVARSVEDVERALFNDGKTYD